MSLPERIKDLTTSTKLRTLLSSLIIALLIPITLFAATQRWELRRKAAEEPRPTPISEQANSPKYAPGEVLVKFRPSVEIKVPEKEQRPFSVESLESEPATKPLADFLKQEGVKSLEKVFKGAGDPKTDLQKFKQKFPQRKIKEKELEKIDLSRTYKLTFTNPDKVDVLAKAQELSQNPSIEYAEPNYIYRTQGGPNDPYYQDSYPNNTDNRDPNWDPPHDYQWNIKKTNSSNNWLIDTSGIVVAVIDTGVDVTHPELGNIWINTEEIPDDGLDNDENGCIDDINGCNTLSYRGNVADDNNHGTHVAGIISAKTNNSIGLAGVTNNTPIMAVKTLNADGVGLGDWVARGIFYAANNGARVLNMSLGGTYQSTMKEALDYATSLGVISVVAAGNGNLYSPKYFPSSYGPAITVGGVDEELNKLRYANYGPNINVAAPAGGKPCLYSSKPSYCSNILSLKSSQNEKDQELVVGGQYLRLSGTSMATPHVAGVVALLLAQHPKFTLAEIENYIRFNSTDPQGLGHTEQLGWGVLDSTGTEFVEPSDIDFEVVYPAEKALVGREFIVAGTISAINFDHYDVEYKNEGESYWSREGVDLVSGGTHPIVPDYPNASAEIANILLSDDAPRGVYLVRVTLFMTNGRSISATKRIYFLQKPGTAWLEMRGQTQSVAPTGDILTADLNEDGNQEIILYNYGPYDNETLSVFDNENNLLWQVAQQGEVVVGDVDKRSPGKEIILQTKDSNIYTIEENIFVYDSSGNRIDDMTIDIDDSSRRFKPNILVIDADQNGVDELYFYQERYSRKRLRVFEQNSEGQFMEKWNVDVAWGESTPSFVWPVSGDLNGDGKKEIVVFKDGNLAVIDHNGQEIASSEHGARKIAIGDINGDGKEEIIIATNSTTALQVQGNTIVEMWTYDNGHGVDSLALADFNNDGLPDIYTQVSTIREDTVLDYNGNILFKNRAPLYFSNAILNGGVVLMDRDNNGEAELYQVGRRDLDDRGYLNVQEFDPEAPQAVFIDGEWKVVSNGRGRWETWERPIAGSDLDGNGKVDLVIAGVGIIEYETQGVAYWPHRYHDYQRTGSYNFSPPEEPTCIPGSLLDGDTNCDCAVNIFDLVRVGANYGKTADDPDWDPLADVVADGRINIFDLVKVGVNYGRSCP